MRTRYRIDDFQESYFVIRSLDELLSLAHTDFAPLYERVRRQSELEPGTSHYHHPTLRKNNGRLV